MKPYDPGHARTKAAISAIAAGTTPPPRIAAMVIYAKAITVANEGRQRLWHRVWVQPNGDDGWWEVTAVRHEGTLAETKVWAFVYAGKGRSKFGTGMRFSLGRADTIRTPREWRTWVQI